MKQEINQKIITYLQSNKNKYDKGILVTALHDAGYGENDIQEAVNFVYGNIDKKDVSFSPKRFNFFQLFDFDKNRNYSILLVLVFIKMMFIIINLLFLLVSFKINWQVIISLFYFMVHTIIIFGIIKRKKIFGFFAAFLAFTKTILLVVSQVMLLIVGSMVTGIMKAELNESTLVQGFLYSVVFLLINISIIYFTFAWYKEDNNS